MKNHIRYGLAVLGLIVLGASTVAAQEAKTPVLGLCKPDTTIAECWKLYFDSSKATVRALSGDEIQKGQADVMDGPDTSGSESATMSKSFRERFSAVVEKVSLDESTGAIVLNWNTDFLKATKGELQLQSIIRTPAIHSQVEKAIPESTRAARKAILEKQFNDLDDLSFAVSYVPQTKNLGRAFAANAETFKKWKGDAEKNLLEEERRLASALSKIQDRFNEFHDSVTGNVTFRNLATGSLDEAAACDSSCEELAKDIIADLELAFWRLEKAQSASSDAILTGLPWVFGALLQNQPQLTLTYKYDSRSELAGPDQSTIGVAYQRGFPSLNTFKGMSSISEQGIERAKSNLNRGYQLTASAEYGSSPAHDFTIPASEGFPEALPVAFEKVTSLKWSASFSMVLTYDQDTKPTSTLALSAKYLDVSNVEKQRDQLIGVLTYTKKLNDTLDLPLALVYANHSRYLADDDKAISAHFAIRYQLKKKAVNSDNN